MNYHPLRAILLDPFDKAVRELTLLAGPNDSALAAMKWVLGCDYVEVVDLGGGNDLWVDEEALLAEPPPAHFIETDPDTGMRIGSRGLILCHDGEGETTAAKLPIVIARHAFIFTERDFLGFNDIPDGEEIDHPVFGKMPLTGSRPQFGPRKQ